MNFDHNHDGIKSAVAVCVSYCLGGYRQATKYLTPQLTVKATRQRKPDHRSTGDTILLTIGRPNYLERRFVKLCRKAGESVWPVRKVQLRQYNKK